MPPHPAGDRRAICQPRRHVAGAVLCHDPKWAVGEFTEAELEKAVDGMANHKAVGPDGVPIEVFRCPSCRAAILPILNRCYHTGVIPGSMLSASQVPLHKKGDLDTCGNYRGICLLSLITKILDKMMMHRTRDALDALLLPCQNAYRPERSCKEHVNALTELIDLARRANNVPLVCLFVDFSKAFDSVDRRQLRRLLVWWNCPQKLLDLMFVILDGQQLAVRLDGEHGKTFTPTAGVLQGDTLAPYLFLIVMDAIFRYTDPDPHTSLGFDLCPPLPGTCSSGTRSRHQRPRTGKALPLLGYAVTPITRRCSAESSSSSHVRFPAAASLRRR